MPTISELNQLKGKLPPRVLALVIEWAALNQSALESDWELAELHKPLNKINPLV